MPNSSKSGGVSRTAPPQDKIGWEAAEAGSELQLSIELLPRAVAQGRDAQYRVMCEP